MAALEPTSYSYVESVYKTLDQGIWSARPGPELKAKIFQLEGRNAVPLSWLVLHLV